MKSKQVSYIRKHWEQLMDSTDVSDDLTVLLYSQGFLTEDDITRLNYASILDEKVERFYEIVMEKENGYDVLRSALHATGQTMPWMILNGIDLPEHDDLRRLQEGLEEENRNVVELLARKMGLNECIPPASTSKAIRGELRKLESGSCGGPELRRLIVGDEPCTCRNIIKLLQRERSRTNVQVTSNWRNIARELDISRDLIAKFSQDILLDKKDVIDVMEDILEVWRSAQGSEAKLSILLQAFQNSDMKGFAEKLQANFM